MSRYETEYRYANGELSSERTLNGEEPVCSWTTRYDDDGDLISKSFNDYNDYRKSWERGFLKGDTSKTLWNEYYDRDQEIFVTQVYVYDDADNLILTENFNSDHVYLGGRQRYCNGVETDELHASVVFNGKKYSFNATELRKIEKTLGDFANDLGAALKTVAKRCSIIAGIVSSNDTRGYSATLNNAGNSILSWTKDVNGFVDDLAGDIEKYVHDTIVNESGQKENLHAINNALDNLNDFFDTIDDYY